MKPTICGTGILSGLVGLGAWFSPLELSAQTNAAATAHPLTGERFLLVVETSSASRQRAENIQKVAGAMVAGGLSGHMLPGSTIGVWTFNDQLHAGQFPLQVWRPESRQNIARRVTQFLQQQTHEKSPRLTTVREPLARLLAQSERLTVIYVTSGSEPITGTTEDAMIVETFRSNAQKQRDLQMPFITVVRATRGQVVATAVTTPPWSLEVPEYPDVPKPDPAALAPAAVEPVTPADPVAPRRDPGVLSPTNIIYLVETSAPPATVPVMPEVPAAVPTNDVTPALAPETKPPPAPPPTNLPPLPPATPPAAEVVGATTAESEPAPPAAPKAKHIIVVLGVGSALLLVLVGLLVFLLRRARVSRSSSLITDSLNRRHP